MAGDSPRGVLVGRRKACGLTHTTKRQALTLVVALAGLVATLLMGAGSATADPTISSKRDQARAIVAQIREMDTELGHAIEAYNLANVQLDQIDVDLDVNGRHLVTAKASLGIAQLHIAKRLRALYINGDSAGAIEVVLGARSLDDLLDRLDMAQTVGGHDAKVVKSVRQFRNEVRTRRAKLRDDRAQQAQLVAERASRKQWIEGQLAERQRLLSSVRTEIAQMEAAERRRQARLEAQARARLEAEAAARANREAADARARARAASRRSRRTRVAHSRRRRRLPPGTAARSGSRCSTSGFPTSGAVRARRASTARDSSPTSMRSSASRCPHNAAMQYNTVGVYVSRDQLQPGDLVFFSGLGHMGMYIGGDQFIHAPHTGDVVKISSMSEGYYASGYVGAKRVHANVADAGCPTERRTPGTRPVSGFSQTPALPATAAPALCRTTVSTSSAKCSSTTRRFSFRVGVTSPCVHLEVPLEDPEALELLVARALAVDVLDDPGHELRDPRVGRRAPRRRRRSPARPPTCRSRRGRA